MNTTGSNLQQVQHAAGQKPVVKDSAATATTHEAIQANRGVQPSSLDQDAPNMVHTFAAPPPLLQKRSNVKRSYTSLVAMSPMESLLPPSSHAQTQPSEAAKPAFEARSLELALASQINPSLGQCTPALALKALLQAQMTPSPVVDEVITDTKAVADLCSVLNADEGVLMTNPDVPSLARSKMYVV